MQPSAIVLIMALASSGVASAQQSLPSDPPANPGEVVPDQRLENVDQRLLTSGEELRRAAEADDQDRKQTALGQGRNTLESVRDVFDDLPAEQRQPYLDAIAKAQQVLDTGDAGSAAEAMKTLQETVRDLAASGG